MTNIKFLKESLRNKQKQILKNQSKINKDNAGKAILLFLGPWLLNRVPIIKKIGTFKSFTDELNTIYINKFLKENNFIQIPSENLQQKPDLDCILVPGLAFDIFGYRLGRGLGFYDRILSLFIKKKHKPIFIGLALDEQIVDKVPTETHDIKMDFICTPNLGVLKAKGE